MGNIIDICKRYRLQKGLGGAIHVALIAKGKSDAKERYGRWAERQLAKNVPGQCPQSKFRERKKPSDGFVAVTTLDEIDNLKKPLWSREEIEPYCMTFINNECFISGGETQLTIFKLRMGTPYEEFVVMNPKFSRIHTVDFSKAKPERLLIASTGVDRIVELNLATKEICWEWDPWRHGYDRNEVGLTMLASGNPIPQGCNVRIVNFEEAHNLVMSGRRVPEDQAWVHVVDFAGRPLRKWQRTVSPNHAIYGQRPGTILSSLLKTGEVVEINMATGEPRVMLAGLIKPHGPVAFDSGYLIVDTGRGQVVATDRELKVTDVYDFSSFSLRNEVKERQFEWLQSTSCLGPDLFAAVDSRRSSVFVWNPSAQVYSQYSFNSDVTLQAVVPIPYNVLANWQLRSDCDQKDAG